MNLKQQQKKLNQQQKKLNQIKTLTTKIHTSKKYSFAWFNSLLQLEYLLTNKQTDTTTQPPHFILKTLQQEFQNLKFNQHYDLKQNLPKNIKYIIGPPGTGKTTYLIQNHLTPQKTNNQKILILTPTNKAADILTSKILSETTTNNIIRFGITQEPQIKQAGILKNTHTQISKIKQCLLITTTARFIYDGFKTTQLKNYKWDQILIDEASMINLAEITYILYQQKPNHFIIAGDPYQIQPIVKAQQWQNENIYTITNLTNLKTPPSTHKITNLTTQYRSLPPIGTLLSHYSYNGTLKPHRSITETKFKIQPITIIKYPNNQNQLYRPRRLKNGSTYHIYSAILTTELTLYLTTKLPQTTKIGIISPYQAQANLIEQLLTTQLSNTPQITTGTIHKFQGDEFDIVLNTINLPPKNNPKIFPNRQHIINVAISRAKNHIIIIIPETPKIEQLTKLEQLILNNQEIQPHSKLYTATQLEEKINEKNYIEKNTQITERQNINVYTGNTKYKYEIRIDKNGIDIRINNK